MSLLTEVCESLEELCGRLAGSIRGCANQLGQVISLGQELVTSLLPILLVGIVDAIESTTLPLISVESLVASAVLQDSGEAHSSDAFLSLWRTDCGHILKELLLSAHFQELWGFEGARRHSSTRARKGVLDEWLELRHRWMDIIDGPDASLGASTGIQILFRPRNKRDVQQSYLDLYKAIDNLMMFLSLLVRYRRFANLGGDAAMYHLRESFHHLLQQIELALAQMLHLASKVMQEVRSKVLELMLVESKISGRTQLWVERLQHINETRHVKNYRSLLEAIQQLRYLSSEARLPALQASCMRSLEQITNITSSAEFRGRCLEAPPLHALQLPAPPAAVEVGSMSSSSGAEAGPKWSVERTFWLKADEVAALQGDRSSLLEMHDVYQSLGQAVDALNTGATPESSSFCIIRCQPSRSEAGPLEYACLYQTGARTAAIEGLNFDSIELHLSAQSPLLAEEEPHIQHEEVEIPRPEAAAPAEVPPTPTTQVTEPAVQPGRSCQAEEQNNFYELLFLAVLPCFTDGDLLTGSQAKEVFRRAGLQPEALDRIFRLEAVNDGDLVDCNQFRLLGLLVAHSQASGFVRSDQLASVQGTVPSCVPGLRGLTWDGRRLRVLEPFIRSDPN